MVRVHKSPAQQVQSCVYDWIPITVSIALFYGIEVVLRSLYCIRYFRTLTTVKLLAQISKAMVINLEYPSMYKDTKGYNSMASHYVKISYMYSEPIIAFLSAMEDLHLRFKKCPKTSSSPTSKVPSLIVHMPVTFHHPLLTQVVTPKRSVPFNDKYAFMVVQKCIYGG